MDKEQERPFQLEAVFSLAATDKPGEYRSELVRAGRIRNRVDEDGHVEMPADALRAAVQSGMFDDLACFVDHSWRPSMRDLFGVWRDVEWSEEETAVVGTLRVYESETNTPVRQVIDQVLADAAKGGAVPDIGTSLVFYAVWEVSDIEDDPYKLARFRKVESCDVVFMPATRSRIKKALSVIGQGDLTVDDETIVANGQGNSAAAAGAGAAVPAVNGGDGLAAGAGEWLAAVAQTAVPAILQNSGLPQASIGRLAAGTYANPAALNAAIKAERDFLAALEQENVVQLNGRPRRGITAGDMEMDVERAQQSVDFFLGVQGAALPPANMRNLNALYVALTGDSGFTGMFNAELTQLASANTATLSNMAVNAMNKVVSAQFSALADYRWFEQIVDVVPNDGSVHDMQWISFGGIGDLPVVPEGSAYDELTVDDVKESAAFYKRGGYVGITLEMFRNSDALRMQLVIKALANASLRTRSARIASIFTQNSGVGPTLAQDSTALFHSNHTNVATTAFGTDATAWRAARAECYKHTEVNSGKRLGIRPRFALTPIDLFDIALAVFGYGEGMPVTYTPEAQDRGYQDPRPIPLSVPDWTDATDWAYITDPKVFPVIQMSYAQNPGGGSHPQPELYSVVSPTAGLMFSNDTMPIKIRDWFAYGVNGWRGIGKRNVA